MLISSDVDTSGQTSPSSSVLLPATTSRFMPALPWWTVLTWERRLSTRLNPRPHLSHRKGFSPAQDREGDGDREGCTIQTRANFLDFCHVAQLRSDLTGVNDNVLGQVSHVNKGLVAHVTFVRPDVVVMTNVIGQLTGLNKPAQINHVVSKGFQKSTIQMDANFGTLSARTFCRSDRTRRVSPQCAGGRERSGSWPE